ncbi:protein IQ-DOMAIN 33-like isoform X2 [Aristolochia californica]|uniref:protein IQ-DOMAIN 33-like isoform X2 n=1 Tax=Aristolochia californica TaxID=171875 RepID=UPI0035D621DD
MKLPLFILEYIRSPKPKSPSRRMPSKEEWNDSTVSSNIAKLRIQHRQEATTRRERALAYAFSQQSKDSSIQMFYLLTAKNLYIQKETSPIRLQATQLGDGAG